MKKTAAFLIALSTLTVSTGTARADIVINGSDEFRKAVQACIDKINKSGDDMAKILSDLEKSDKIHVIVEGTKPPNGAVPKVEDDARLKDDGGTGKGTGSTTTWGPKVVTPYTEGIARDPCASLLHELSHARDFDQGLSDTRKGPSGIPNEEVKACTNENIYRKANSLPIRKKYGTNDLPASAIPRADDVKDDVKSLPNANVGGQP